MSPRPRTAGLLVLLLAAALSAPPAGAQLYRWVDEEGRLHVTDDLSRVPPALRAEVEAAAGTAAAQEPVRPSPAPPAAGAGSAAPAVPGAPPAAAPASPAPDRPRRWVVPVQRAGLEMGVVAEVNGRTRVPFVVDTGATINTIPRRYADEIGLEIDESAPVTVVQGISGEPLLVPIATLRAVRLGGAEVENVEAAVLDTLEVGLLGMPFFNHFRVQTDPAAGTLTLEEIDLSAVEGVYGGYPEEYWRARFRTLRGSLANIERYRERIPEEFGELHERLDRAERYWRDQYEQLELRASRAGVPRSWRE